jgi:hypothetical protein
MIYFIEAMGLVKIGYSNNPKRRLQMLATGCPAPCTLLAVRDGDQRDERELHRKFSHLRSHGEWFRLTSKLRDFIRDNATEWDHGKPSTWERYLSPAREIVAVMGGPRVVAEITGRDTSRVYRWMMPRKTPASTGGTGGSIPVPEFKALLAYAKANSIDLRADDFFPNDRLPAVLAQRSCVGASS